jgi:hypothetical protein
MLLSGCGFDLQRLVATVASDYVPSGARPCPRPDARAVPAIAALTRGFDAKYAELPYPLQSDRFISSVFLQAKYLSVNSVRIAKQYHDSLSVEDASIATSLPRPSTLLTQADIVNFASLTSEYIFRETSSPVNDADRNPNDPFWKRLRGYYDAYYTGKFVTYFGRTFNQPQNSLTITDNDIVQGMTVFLDLIFDQWDETFNLPVWSYTETLPDRKKVTYYPGGTENRPTSVALGYREPKPIVLQSSNGCGIDVLKAKTIAHLANSFARAASMDTGLIIKSFGGLHVGLGVAGKLSIGDNSTLTMLAQGAVSEVVTRLTVELTSPILAALDFRDSYGSVGLAAKIAGGKSRESAWIHQMSVPFVSPNR